MNNPSNFVWVGSEKDFVDQPSIHQLNHIIIGRFGGNSSSGQYKNEDGCLVWFDYRRTCRSNFFKNMKKSYSC